MFESFFCSRNLRTILFWQVNRQLRTSSIQINSSLPGSPRLLYIDPVAPPAIGSTLSSSNMRCMTQVGNVVSGSTHAKLNVHGIPLARQCRLGTWWCHSMRTGNSLLGVMNILGYLKFSSFLTVKIMGSEYCQEFRYYKNRGCVNICTSKMKRVKLMIYGVLVCWSSFPVRMGRRLLFASSGSSRVRIEEWAASSEPWSEVSRDQMDTILQNSTE